MNQSEIGIRGSNLSLVLHATLLFKLKYYTTLTTQA